MRRLFSSEALRTWFYRRARAGTGAQIRALCRPDQKVEVIGDALNAGKCKEAIASAFHAAYFGAR